MTPGVANEAQRRRARPRLSEVVAILGSFARAHYELRATRRGARVRCFGALSVSHRDGIVVGERAVFLGGPIATALRCASGAELVVGERSICNYGVEIAASTSVRVGSDCMIASLVHIRDNDGRRTRPVVIGNGVWIAHGAVIEPGAIIGDGAVVATMAVVAGVVPSRSLAAGNPAQCVPLDGTDAVPSLGDRALARHCREHSPDEVRRAIFEWLDDTRLFGEAERLVTSDTLPLRENGLLDSLGTVELLQALEKRFGVVIDRGHATQLQSVKAFIELVTQPGTTRAA